MAYQVNTAKDARGDEGLFVENFQKNLSAITAAKRKFNIDYETAYQRVTGQPWPQGRSVKVENGRAVMTKDRTVKSVLAKYVAPAAAAVAAPFVLPALVGGGAAAGGAAAAGGGAAAAGGGAATAAGTTAAIAGGASWLRPLLQYGVPAAAGLVGQHMANRADSQASQIESGYLDRALDVEKEQQQYGRTQYADYLGRLKPFQEQGQAAVGRAGSLLTGGGGQPQQGGPMVKLRAPDGSVSDVPEPLADHYLQRGAQRV